MTSIPVPTEGSDKKIASGQSPHGAARGDGEVKASQERNNRPNPTGDRTTRDVNSGHQLVAKLGRRYTFVLVSVVVLIAVDQALIQPLLVRLNFYAPVINVSGRQRMLSQKLAKTALALYNTPGDPEPKRQQLKETVEQWTRAHEGLLRGSQELGLPRPRSPEILAAFGDLQPHFDAMRSAAQQLAAEGVSADQQSDLVSQLLRHEVHYLPIMDNIVNLFEAEARQQVGWLRVAGVSLMITILLLLTSVGWFVISPANRAIHQHVDDLEVAHSELERRVAERTAELRRANRSLEQQIVERRLAEEKSKQLSNQLAHASRVTMAGQLATGLAHELNQPLAALSNYAGACELLIETPESRTSEAVADNLTKIKASALRAGDIIRRMRNFLKPQSTTTEEVSPQELLEEVHALCLPEASQADVDLQLQVEVDATVLHVDRIRIQQVVVNLIHNAIQSMKSLGDGPRLLQVGCRRVGGNVEIEVLDTGTGFSSPSPEAAFSEFFSTKPDGLGMGLSISHAIVDEYQGRMWARNRDEGGACVGFALPATTVEAPQVA